MRTSGHNTNLSEVKQDGRWVTVNGRAVFLPKGREKETLSKTFGRGKPKKKAIGPKGQRWMKGEIEKARAFKKTPKGQKIEAHRIKTAPEREKLKTDIEKSQARINVSRSPVKRFMAKRKLKKSQSKLRGLHDPSLGPSGSDKLATMAVAKKKSDENAALKKYSGAYLKAEKLETAPFTGEGTEAQNAAWRKEQAQAEAELTAVKQEYTKTTGKKIRFGGEERVLRQAQRAGYGRPPKKRTSSRRFTR